MTVLIKFSALIENLKTVPKRYTTSWPHLFLVAQWLLWLNLPQIFVDFRSASDNMTERSRSGESPLWNFYI